MVKIIEIRKPVKTVGNVAIIGIVNIDNGCCNGQPVLITANQTPDKSINYSCQCACGCWCTTGHESAGEALKDYEEMTEKAGRRSDRNVKRFTGYSLEEAEDYFE